MADYQGNGTWGPQTGFLGQINPFSRDQGLTEIFAQKSATPTTFYNPNATAVVNGQNSSPQLPSSIQPRIVVPGGGGPVPNNGGPVPNNGGPVPSGTPSSPGDSELDILAKTDRNPIQDARYKQLLEARPEQQTIDYDAMIRPALEALDQSIAPQESAYQANIMGIDANTAKAQGELGQSLTTAQTEAGRNRERLTGQTESAVDEARRQFAEIQQGLQARYGGTTGSGAFTEGLAGRQALQNIGQQRTALTQAISTIDDRLEQVRSVTELAKQDTEQQAQAQKAQAKAQLDNALNSIRIARGELLSKKVQLAQEAMQFYQQQVAQVEARNAAFTQQLFRDQQAAEQKLLEAKSTAGSAIQKLQLVNIDSIPYVFNPYTGATQKANGTMGPVNTGGIQGEEDQYGAGSIDELNRRAR